MPRHQTYYSPDSIDCAALVTALGEDFGQVPELKTSYELDQIVVICTCRLIAEAPTGAVTVQAINRAPLKSRKDLYVMHYAVLLDCYHQIDRGVLGVAQTPMERHWNGRPRIPRPRT